MDTTYDKYVSSERLGNLERRFRSVSGMFKTALANMLTKADSFPFIEDEDEAMLTIVSMNCIKLLEGICHELDQMDELQREHEELDEKLDKVLEKLSRMDDKMVKVQEKLSKIESK